MKTSTRIAVLGALAAGLVLAAWIGRRAWTGHHRNAVTAREIATQGLGAHLAGKYPQSKAVVISNPFAERGGMKNEVYQFEKAGIRGLRSGFGKGIEVAAVALPDLTEKAQRDPASALIDPETTTPLSFLMADGAFDSIAAAHSDAALLVSLIGVPLRITQSEIWRKPSGPKLALLLPDLRMIGNQQAILSAIHAGKIAAIVLNKPGAPAEDSPVEADWRTEFDRRYLLVTPETVDKLIEKYPRLLIHR